MTEAWSVRSGQQQRFIEELVRKTRDKIDELSGDKDVMDGFADWENVGEEDEDMEHLQEKLKEDLLNDFLFAVLYRQDASAVSGAEYPGLMEFYIKEILDPLTSFTRAWEEFEALRARFIVKVIETMIQRPAESELKRVERESPQTIFHAPSAMTEID
ncbi:MAG TPA: hypothetical protein VFK07_01285 [Candidatus Paceibacterota bacterium]|nr:hypothetical protein [Candidatus Paceibacterota bacterium]